MNRPSGLLMIVAGSALLALGARFAGATTVRDLARLKGHEHALLTGMGIVVGLNGTGDTSKDSYVAARPYAALLTNLGNPVVDFEELAKANAYAIVQVTMRIPPTGVRDGDRLDVSVEKLFNAKSLAGGRLVASLLRLPGPDSPDLLPMAFAEGPLQIEGDNPASALVRNGGQMITDIRSNVVQRDGTITLVLEEQYAGFSTATMLADAINDEFAIDGLSNVAYAEDAKNVRVLIPEPDRLMPAPFIATVTEIPIDPSLIRTKARIVVNERAGIIAVTGNVELGPVGVSHRGMKLTSVTQGSDAGAAAAPPRNGRWAGLDTSNGASRTSTQLLDLLGAFDRLSVPVEDQIAIIYELKKTGALHAEIVSE